MADEIKVVEADVKKEAVKVEGEIKKFWKDFYTKFLAIFTKVVEFVHSIFSGVIDKLKTGSGITEIVVLGILLFCADKTEKLVANLNLEGWEIMLVILAYIGYKVVKVIKKV